jgi:hypothetical protein
MTYDEFDPYEHWLGIEPSEHPVDHYRLLGVERFEDDLVRIATAADERMRYIRTFQTGPRGIHTQRLLNELSAAKLRLLDPESKRQYDQRLRTGPSDEPDPLQGLEEAVLPPGLSESSSPSTPVVDPMVPLDLANQAHRQRKADSGPIIQVESKERSGRPKSGRRRAATTGRELTGKDAQGAGTPSGLVRHLVGFAGGALLIAVTVWAVGNFYFGGSATSGSSNGEGSGRNRSGWGARNSSAVAPVAQQPDGSFLLSTDNVRIEGKTARVITDESGSAVHDWLGTDEVLTWQLDVRQVTLFRARLTYAVDDTGAGGSIRVTWGDRTKDWDLRASGGFESFITDEFPLSVGGPGKHALTIKPVTKPGREVMRFRSLELIPSRRGR